MVRVTQLPGKNPAQSVFVTQILENENVSNPPFFAIARLAACSSSAKRWHCKQEWSARHWENKRRIIMWSRIYLSRLCPDFENEEEIPPPPPPPSRAHYTNHSAPRLCPEKRSKPLASVVTIQIPKPSSFSSFHAKNVYKLKNESVLKLNIMQ